MIPVFFLYRFERKKSLELELLPETPPITFRDHISRHIPEDTSYPKGEEEHISLKISRTNESS